MKHRQSQHETAPAALVYHAGALGDVITALPAVALYRRHRPGTEVVFLGKPAVGRLLVWAGYADRAWSVDRGVFAGLFGGGPSPELQRLFKGIDEAVLYTAPGSGLAAAVKQCSVSSIFRHPAAPEARDHAVVHHLAAFGGAFDLPENPVPVIPLGRTPAAGKLPAHSERAVLHPGSGSPLKNWPANRFRRLADRFRNDGRRVFWIRGPSDGPVPADASDTVLRTDDLVACAVLLAGAGLFVGNDSGLSHLAAATGCPSVVLFGPSDPAVWRPLGDHVRVVATGRPCGPCHLRGGEKVRCDRGCMSDISVDAVYDAAESFGKPHPGGRLKGGLT